jgi:hypothetical protein
VKIDVVSTWDQPRIGEDKTNHLPNLTLSVERYLRTLTTSPSAMWSISCHCGATAQSIRPRAGGDEGTSLCHCDVCRHTTGALCTSYLPIHGPPDQLDKTTSYEPGDGRVLIFCSRCGCHVFQRREAGGEWEVASGVIAGGDEEGPEMFFTRHVGVEETRDGGLSRWLHFGEGKEHISSPAGSVEQKLEASCHCRTVSFSISRPSPTSREPRANYPDLMMAYNRTDPKVLENPSDEKWWLRNGGRFLAGTCACVSCRSTLGFETQAWAFVPRTDIIFAGEVTPPDFEALHARGTLKGYVSSEGVVRESCPRCGATVFWRDRWRPGVVDVSVGLLRAGEGALAEGWLDWWKGRVSFAEDAGKGRTGIAAARAEKLIGQLEGGLKGE